MSGAGGGKRPPGGDSPPGPPEKKSKKEEKTTTTLIEPIRIAGVSSTVRHWLFSCIPLFVPIYYHFYLYLEPVVHLNVLCNIIATKKAFSFSCSSPLPLCLFAGGDGHEGPTVQE